jgi:SAM-dependent methyltransferase
MDAAGWDARYGGAELVWRADPNRFVAEEVAGLEPGPALDLACGEGRNAVWLAEQGWEVLAVDFSAVGLAKGARLAEERGVEVTWQEADVVAWAAPADAFDLVIACYLQLPAGERRTALVGAARAVAPGGTLLVVAHDLRNLDEGTGGPPDPAVLYRPADVLDDVGRSGAPFTVVRAETVERPVDGAGRPALDCLVRVERRRGT